jgi:hypothetical protein
MKATISFVVTSWEPEAPPTRALVASIARQGIEKECIRISDERISRPVSLNRAIASCDSDYIGFCESDVVPSPNAVETLTRLLDRNPRVGLAAAKVQPLSPGRVAPVPIIANEAKDEAALEDISEQMWTLNFVLYRKSTQVLFDESYFGNQIFDWDFGLELLHHGYTSIVDARCAVAHQPTDYCAKSLSYHACVARNRQIFAHKWRCRAEWPGLREFQSKHPGVIPTVEELTHATEAWLFRYIARHDPHSLREFYFNARFGDASKVEDYLQRMRPLLDPQTWSAPVVTTSAKI